MVGLAQMAANKKISGMRKKKKKKGEKRQGKANTEESEKNIN